MKKRFLRGLLAIAAAVSCCTGVFAEYTDYGSTAVYDGKSYEKNESYTESFDNYADITAVTDSKWKGSTDYISLTPDQESGKAITLNHNGDTLKTETEIYKDINVNCESGPVVVSEDVCFSDNVSRRKLMLFMHWGDPKYEISGIYAHENGYFTLDADGENKLAAYEANKWYNVKAVIDCEADTIEYVIDGQNVGEKISIDPNFSNITRFTPIKQCGTSEIGTVSVDNCKAYNLKEIKEKEYLTQSKGMVTRKNKNYSVNEFIDDDFSGYTEEGAPENWVIGGDGTVAPAEIDSEHGTSVKLTKAGSDTEIYRVNNISNNMDYTDGIYMFSADYKFGDASSNRFLMEVKGLGLYLIAQSGTIKTSNNENLASFDAEKWYNITVVIDTPQQKYEYYINGELVTEGTLNGFTKTDRVTLAKQRGPQNWVAVDNFQFAKLNEHPESTKFVYDGIKYEGTIIDSEDFSSYVGEKTAPDGWNAVETDDAYTSASVYDEAHGTSVKLTKVNSDAELYKNYSSGLFWDKEALYVISADYMFPDKNTQRPILIVNQNQDSANDTELSKIENYVFMAQNNGWFCLSDGSTRLAQYEANKWYRIQFVADIANQKYMILVNGEVVLPATPFPNYMCNINRVTVAKQRGAGDVFVDNYSISKMKRSIDNEVDNVNLINLYSDGFGLNERTTKVKEDNIVEYVMDQNGYAMKLSGADNLLPYTDLSDEDKKYNKYILSENVKFSDTTQSRYLFAIRFENDSQGKDLLTIKTNGNQLKDANTDEVLMTYEKDKWYKVQLIADIENKTYSVYVDGALVNEKSYTTPVTNGIISRISYISSWGTTHNDVYLDDLSIQTSEEYTVKNSVVVYDAFGDVLNHVSDLMDGDTVTASATFDTTNCNVIIALYNEDGSLKQVVVDKDMKMPNTFDNCTIKAFVLDSETLAPQCKACFVGY